ncbi:hypothetical protein LIA77_02898 [Sarocladium implicatum]|nr:hypothetical protein LIA77_02898 [Sarocladium implicatum]
MKPVLRTGRACLVLPVLTCHFPGSMASLPSMSTCTAHRPPSILLAERGSGNPCHSWKLGGLKTALFLIYWGIMPATLSRQKGNNFRRVLCIM